MNTSNISTYDNVPSLDSLEESEDITFIISDVLKILNLDEPVVFCPFCLSNFSKTLELEKHLRKHHHTFVSELLYRSVAFIVCPFCPAKFCSVNLAARHAIVHHTRLIFDTFFVNSHQGIVCQFCSSKILSNKFMEIHITDNHSLQFNEWFAKKFSPQHGGMAGLVEIQTATVDASKITCVDEDSLNKKLQNLNLLVSSDCSKKSILKNAGGVKRKRKLPVRRELRFCNVDKENVANITVSSRRNSTGSMDDATILEKCNFQCGKCSLSFLFHNQLVHHVKNQHKKLSLNLLHPFYQCALCGAKFFKNSYLKKHSALHQIKRLR